MDSNFSDNAPIPFVSIVVLTFNRKKLLKNCLKSLTKLNYPKSNFEIIVVDGDSKDGTIEMIKTKYPNVRLILEKRKGRPIARNTGWKSARGQIVAYTDDDCTVNANWLKILLSGFDSCDTGAVGGPLLLVNQPNSIREKFKGTPVGDFYLGNKRLNTKELVTANVAVSREVFKKNGFDESLVYDMEDIDFSQSLIEAGYKCKYFPQAEVYHHINPMRLTVNSVLKKALFAGISLYIFERKRTNGFLTGWLFRKSLAGYYNFLLKRKLGNLFWFLKCFVAFLTSIFCLPYYYRECH
ncbi:MAG: glycosyltransferase [Candidatus Thermoplasmatota archaeon]|nr:glycosyltransferase [Candidatus Thermoplasmatota archaeon]